LGWPYFGVRLLSSSQRFSRAVGAEFIHGQPALLQLGAGVIPLAINAMMFALMFPDGTQGGKFLEVVAGSCSGVPSPGEIGKNLFRMVRDEPRQLWGYFWILWVR